ncbi:MAG: aminotransferase class V-fold PLP-dependent enzyme [bacterium]|nr:aminotransferase class V-fold PLP-dependent enzyme [bacterium]
MNLWKLINGNKKTLFTTPSHGQKSPFLKELNEFYKRDLSEIEGFDNLSDPKGIIRKAQFKACEIYGTEKTFFLTQGATTGILAAMKAVIRPTDRILLARNCHKSVLNGAVLCNAEVDWILPDSKSEVSLNWGVYGAIDPSALENQLKLNDYRAFIMTSPTYEGIYSDIEAISKICRQYNTYLIVDEAHGSLYNFSESFPKTAIESGADFSVNSLHKNAGALNQCALLHMSKDCKDIDSSLVQNAVNLFHTTSPSYPLLSVIEETIGFLNSKEGLKTIDELVLNIINFKEYFKNTPVEFLNGDNHDITKLFLKIKGLKGGRLSEILYESHNIEDEFNNDFGALFLTGIGTTKAKLDKLRIALLRIIENEKNLNYEAVCDFQPQPLVKIQPCLAFYAKETLVNRENSELMISSSSVIPYPPGIGILYPGEAIQQWHMKYLEENAGVIKL